MKFPILLLLTPFGLAIACGARTGALLGEEDDATSAEDSALDDGLDVDGAVEGRPDTAPTFDPGGPPVHCAPGGTAAPAMTGTCAPGSDCHVEGDRIVCGDMPPTLNCGRLNCSGRCKCLIPSGPNASCICN